MPYDEGALIGGAATLYLCDVEETRATPLAVVSDPKGKSVQRGFPLGTKRHRSLTGDQRLVFAYFAQAGGNLASQFDDVHWQPRDQVSSQFQALNQFFAG